MSLKSINSLLSYFKLDIGNILHISVYLRNTRLFLKHANPTLLSETCRGLTPIDLARKLDYCEFYVNDIQSDNFYNESTVIREFVFDKYINPLVGYKKRSVKMTPEYICSYSGKVTVIPICDAQICIKNKKLIIFYKKKYKFASQNYEEIEKWNFLLNNVDERKKESERINKVNLENLEDENSVHLYMLICKLLAEKLGDKNVIDILGGLKGFSQYIDEFETTESSSEFYSSVSDEFFDFEEEIEEFKVYRNSLPSKTCSSFEPLSFLQRNCEQFQFLGQINIKKRENFQIIASEDFKNNLIPGNYTKSKTSNENNKDHVSDKTRTKDTKDIIKPNKNENELHFNTTHTNMRDHEDLGSYVIDINTKNDVPFKQKDIIDKVDEFFNENEKNKKKQQKIIFKKTTEHQYKEEPVVNQINNNNKYINEEFQNLIKEKKIFNENDELLLFIDVFNYLLNSYAIFKERTKKCFLPLIAETYSGKEKNYEFYAEKSDKNNFNLICFNDNIILFMNNEYVEIRIDNFLFTYKYFTEKFDAIKKNNISYNILNVNVPYKMYKIINDEFISHNNVNLEANNYIKNMHESEKKSFNGDKKDLGEFSIQKCDVNDNYETHTITDQEQPKEINYVDYQNKFEANKIYKNINLSDQSTCNETHNSETILKKNFDLDPSFENNSNSEFSNKNLSFLINKINLKNENSENKLDIENLNNYENKKTSGLYNLKSHDKTTYEKVKSISFPFNTENIEPLFSCNLSFKNDFVTGTIKKNKKSFAVVKGKWHEKVLVSLINSKKEFVWENNINTYKVYYDFNLYTLQLNSPNNCLGSDSRKREDIRALENGNINYSRESHEIMNNREKLRENENRSYTSRYFVKKNQRWTFKGRKVIDNISFD
ncbi:hypothetical protein COBT_000043 [Conglomerata obtusa]